VQLKILYRRRLMDDIKKIMNEKKFEEYKPWDSVDQNGEV